MNGSSAADCLLKTFDAEVRIAVTAIFVCFDLTFAFQLLSLVNHFRPR